MTKFVRRVIVLNTKGGCGKTTIATNVASLYAGAGYRTALIDQDPQGSSSHWLRVRPGGAPSLKGVAMHEASRTPLSGAWQLKVPRDTERVVVDTPAGVRGLDLAGRITPNDWVLVPVQPSSIDQRAAGDFIRELLASARLRPQDGRLAFVANRTRRNSPALAQLRKFFEVSKIAALAELPDSHRYVEAGERGLGVCELDGAQGRRECQEWRAVMDWLEADGRGKPVAMPSPPEPKAQSKPARGNEHVPAFLTRGWEGEAAAEPKPAVGKDLH